MSSRVLLDNRKTPCAVGMIRAAQQIRDLAPGTVLEIWSRDRFAPMEIPLWAERDGHLAEDRGRAGTWPFRYFVFEVTKREPRRSVA
ncbi:MAG: sulfurtransferase TusA family protein [Intrasporangium sp.]|uniref:sulfurtransferase TusA family protein n=1 Tax=Intrasporangium sp. TaxID=1925024 RepID=UPI0026486F85|nr:sulfurtransferase TusA family protein [Intrasporangium sp.]MDN5797230.1 sulfurtransferase TusA family protein [Intrasporangium sp.]